MAKTVIDESEKCPVRAFPCVALEVGEQVLVISLGEARRLLPNLEKAIADMAKVPDDDD